MCELDEQMWIENCLNDWAQKVMITGQSVVKGISSRVLQGSILGPNLLNTFITSNLDDGADCMPRQFAGLLTVCLLKTQD